MHSYTLPNCLNVELRAKTPSKYDIINRFGNIRICNYKSLLKHEAVKKTFKPKFNAMILEKNVPLHRCINAS